MKVKTINLSNASSYTESELDIIIQDLKKSNKYSNNLVYRGFDGNNINNLLKTGQDTNSEILWGSTEQDIIDLYKDESEDVFNYADKFNIPTLAVFDGNKLEKQFQFAYEFKDKENKLDALVEVYRLKY